VPRTARRSRWNGRSPAAAWSASAPTAFWRRRSSAASWLASASSPPRCLAALDLRRTARSATLSVLMAENLRALIASGKLSTGTQLHHEGRGALARTVTATVTEDGISFNDHTYRSPSGAARATNLRLLGGQWLGLGRRQLGGDRAGLGGGDTPRRRLHGAGTPAIDRGRASRMPDTLTVLPPSAGPPFADSGNLGSRVYSGLELPGSAMMSWPSSWRS